MVKFDWFTNDVKKLSKKLWTPTLNNFKKHKESTGLPNHQNSHLTANNPLPFSYKFYDLNLQKIRDNNIDHLREDKLCDIIILEEKIKYLQDPDHYFDYIDQFINDNIDADNEAILLKLYVLIVQIKDKIKDMLDYMDNTKQTKNKSGKLRKKISPKNMIAILKKQFKSTENKYDKLMFKEDHCLRSLRVKLDFDHNQTNIIHSWLYESKRVYDKCVRLHNHYTEKDPDKIGAKEYFPLNFKKLKLIIFDMLYGKNDKPCPYDILSYEVKTFIENRKSGESNLKANNIDHYNLNYKDTKNGQTITIPIKGISRNGIFPKILGKNNMDLLKKFSFKCDCKITYDKLTNNFYLYVPQYREFKQIQNRDPIVACDPGEKIFLTYYGINKAGHFGMSLHRQILNIQREIKILQHALSKKKNKHGGKLKNKQKVKKLIQKKYRKIRNIVDNVHKKTANYLCKNYDRVLIPKFETKKMVIKDKLPDNVKKEMSQIWKNDELTKEEKKEECKEIYKRMYLTRNQGKSRETIKEEMKKQKGRCRLKKNVKFVLMMQGHYRFKQYLFSKGEENDCLIEEVTEEYTSKACSTCGKLSDEYDENRMKTCTKCGIKINRDLNGGKNILLKNIGKHILKPQVVDI